jgi:hypothetical protein
MGNRGRLHEGRGTRYVVRNHQTKNWLTCAFSFKDRSLTQWEPNRYTLLFFLDEAVVLVAGRRPFAECCRGAYHDFRAYWAKPTTAQCIMRHTSTTSCTANAPTPVSTGLPGKRCPTGYSSLPPIAPLSSSGPPHGLGPARQRIR